MLYFLIVFLLCKSIILSCELTEDLLSGAIFVYSNVLHILLSELLFSS
jgi:hypothetical protein